MGLIPIMNGILKNNSRQLNFNHKTYNKGGALDRHKSLRIIHKFIVAKTFNPL